MRKAPVPTVILFLRIPVELRGRLDAKLRERKSAGAWSATLQSVSVEALTHGLAHVGENPAQLSHPAIPARPTPAPSPAVSRATVDLAKRTAAKSTGARKAKPAAKASKRGGK